MRKSCVLLVVLSCLFVFLGCEVGMGASVDLEAPVISVEELISDNITLDKSHLSGAVYCKKAVTFKGTATDNHEVESVYVEIKWEEDNDFTYFSPCSYSKGKWTVDILFEREGVASLKFNVTDKSKNFSTKSYSVINLFIDDTAPVGNTWYIDRKINGIQYGLKSLSYLKALNLNDSENKDAAQNVGFSIRANFTDTMGIKDVYIRLFDESGNPICRINKTESSGKYAPEFVVTAQDLASLDNNKHYIEVRYSAEDVVTVPESNKTQDEVLSSGWFIWWPDSDKPRIVTTPEEEDGCLNLLINDTLNLSVFDDDSLLNSYCALLTNTEYANLASDWQEHPEKILDATENSDRKKRFVQSSGTERDVVLPLKAPEKPDTTMHFVAFAIDGTQASEKCIKDIPVKVTDKADPLLLIQSPENNSVPILQIIYDQNQNAKNANFTISGKALDTTGCKYLELVWVPSNVEDKKGLAENYLNTIDTEEKHEQLANATNRVTEYNGLKIWSIPLSYVGTSGTGGAFREYSFNLQLDLFKDFITSNNVNEQKLEKYFLTKLTREDEISVYKEYKLKGDTEPPVIEGISPTDDMETITSDSNYTLEFKAGKKSNLPIDSTKYSIIDYNGDTVGEYDSVSKTYKYTITQEVLQNLATHGVKPKYTFHAEDIFGNSVDRPYTLVISDLPVLKSISTSASNQCKAGDIIDIAVAFSKTVNIAESEKSKLKLKIKGIKNEQSHQQPDSPVEVPYKTGSGTTTLHFEYEVNEWDNTVTGKTVTLYDDNPIVRDNVPSLSDEKVEITTNFDNNFDSSKITIDGILPTISAPVITRTGVSDKNKKGSVYHMREGTTITVVLTASENITVQGNPSFVFIVGTGSKTFELPFTGSTDTTITFSKKITKDDENGNLTYIPSARITDADKIFDSYGNPLFLDGSDSSVPANIYIDTNAPAEPEITYTSNPSGRYQSPFTFTITEDTDETIKTVEYSVDGGSNWRTYNSSTGGSLSSSAQLTARVTDYSGNISPIPTPVNLNINDSFPGFSIECTTADGNYKTGTIDFKLTFNEPVNISGDSAAKIYVNGMNSSNYAELDTSKTTKPANSITEAYFKYNIKPTDEFTLKVNHAKGLASGVVLDGFTDLYGFAQGSRSFSETKDYERAIVCDAKKPYILSMVPGSETEEGSNIYAKGNEITITFNEEIQKGSGNIVLRLADGWAIPPVIDGDDFITICNNLTDTQKNILSMQENGLDMEDSENQYGNAVSPKNDKYHGTGQYVGPYKKSSQSLKLEDGKYVPDISVKYVLDFDMDIWETDTEHWYGKTFNTDHEYSAPAHNDTNKRTANMIREVLKAAGIHQRVLDVTDANVSIDKDDRRKVTIKFPKGLIDKTDDLPVGREWELLIDDGAFCDMTDNLYGNDDNTANVIKTSNNQDTFWSDKVATPVVRVDRYSYGLGIFQGTSTGGTEQITGEAKKPSGYVRVRIDCETPGADIYYNDDKTRTNNIDGIDTNNANLKYHNADNGGCDTYFTDSGDLTSIPTVSKTSTEYTGVFAGGTGDYLVSCKEYITSKAFKDNFTDSEPGLEGIYQTVVRFDNPITAGRNSATAQTDHELYSIRGTAGFAGEPYISPFPLRDSQVGSPFLRICFRENTLSDKTSSKDYYWLSYEILVDSSFSAYQWGPNVSYYDWARHWGKMVSGEFSSCHEMRGWQ